MEMVIIIMEYKVVFFLDTMSKSIFIGGNYRVDGVNVPSARETDTFPGR